MPIYMDRHNAEGATFADMAEAHRLDLREQRAHDVRFLAYWFDPERGLAFCLVEAPDATAVKDVHDASHGAVPSDIVEVDLDEVLAFLGRASEPDEGDPAAREFRPDSAFRTIVFTDIAGSTALTQRLGDAGAMELLERHDEAIRRAVADGGGRIVKHTGDGFMISFDRVDDALRAAIRIQREAASLHELLSVKIGINPGNPIGRGEDLFGTAVQIAARLCDLAQAGQVLVAGIVHELCDDPDLADRFVDRGRVPLKGLESALQVYEVRSDST
ncbi:MAG: DUF4242 domain-containing protein [Gemmatimonadota bacterium]|nr:DUF4242 domain-containing protein [Gemmatimonadota bacterium]